MDALRLFDLGRLTESGWLAGVDEAGRGAFAGPVVAAAVFVEADWLQDARFEKIWADVNDSKQISAAKREQLFQQIQEECAEGRLMGASGSASVSEIEQHNILGATRLAMRRALEAACPDDWELPEVDQGALFAREKVAPSGIIVIDGRPLHSFPYAHDAVVKGDGKSFSIALASILAKVTRDHMMVDLDKAFPQYGFRQHKGYGTAAHCAAILQHGPSSVHRPAFLRKLLKKM